MWSGGIIISARFSRPVQSGGIIMRKSLQNPVRRLCCYTDVAAAGVHLAADEREAGGSTMNATRKMLTGVTAGLLGAVIACQPAAPVRGTTGGRIDPYRTTAADRGSHKALMPALLEFCDQTAESLAAQMVEIDRVGQTDGKLVLELGDLRNLTNTPTQDFELIQHRLRGQLLKSRLIKAHFNIVEGVARMDREQNRVTAGQGEGTQVYDADETLILIGDFFESDRDEVRRYFFQFKLVHLASRTIELDETFDLAQR